MSKTGVKLAAGAAAVVLALTGKAIYDDHFSQAAHVKHRCSAAWSRAVGDDARMTALFMLGPDTTATTMQQWLTPAQDMLNAYAGKTGDCFVPGYVKYAADENKYPPVIDTAQLSAAIKCVENEHYPCQPDDHAGFAIPVYMPLGGGYGPTAICSDGTDSYSADRQGTCSHHGGVRQWLR